MLDRCGLLPNDLCNRDAPVTTVAIPPLPTVVIAYVYVAKNQSYHNLALRFLESYAKNPPGYPHETVIACNNGMPNNGLDNQFLKLPKCQFYQHDNSGYDIGAYQRIAQASPHNLMLCLTASTYFNGAGWLARCVEASVKHGDALYGTMGNKGDAHVGVNRHIRSTAFWLTPHLFNQYPYPINSVPARYEFEHKKNCITEWAMRNGIEAWVVTWQSEYQWAQWDDDPEGFHRGKQKNLIIGDHITEKPHYPRQ